MAVAAEVAPKSVTQPKRLSAVICIQRTTVRKIKNTRINSD